MFKRTSNTINNKVEDLYVMKLYVNFGIYCINTAKVITEEYMNNILDSYNFIKEKRKENDEVFKGFELYFDFDNICVKYDEDNDIVSGNYDMISGYSECNTGNFSFKKIDHELEVFVLNKFGLLNNDNEDYNIFNELDESVRIELEDIYNQIADDVVFSKEGNDNE